MVEYVVLVDEENNEVGTALKSEVHTMETPLHRAFSSFLFNDDGLLLMQQRASHKKTWPLIWSNSCCGHPAPGESFEDAVQRRLDFELGMKATELHMILPKFRYQCELYGVVENEFCPVFVGRYSGKAQPNPEEVEATRLVTWDEWVAQTQDPEGGLSQWCIWETEQMNENELFLQLLRDWGIR